MGATRKTPGSLVEGNGDMRARAAEGTEAIMPSRGERLGLLRAIPGGTQKPKPGQQEVEKGETKS